GGGGAGAGARLLPRLAPPRGWPRLERHEQALGQILSLTVARAKRPSHRRDDVGPDQHVAGDRELLGLLVTAPRHAARSGVAEGALAVQPMHLTDVALAILA